jgi:clan AA aspartic protease (TIGR02281 family)
MRRAVATGMILFALFCSDQPASAWSAAGGAGVAVAGNDPAGVPSLRSSPAQVAQPSRRGAAQAGGENWTRREERVISGGDEPTKVRVRGNAVLVPVTVVCGGREADVHLLLDTGASATTLHAAVAERLAVDLDRAKKARVQVVGGEVLEARVIQVDSLTVGPHTKRNVRAVVVPHRGPASGYDGLLGMDVLRGLKYRVDFNRELLVWE